MGRQATAWSSGIASPQWKPPVAVREGLHHDGPALADGLGQRQLGIHRKPRPTLHHVLAVPELPDDLELRAVVRQRRHQRRPSADLLDRVLQDGPDDIGQGRSSRQGRGEPLQHHVSFRAALRELIGPNRVDRQRGAAGELHDEPEVVSIVVEPVSAETSVSAPNVPARERPAAR